MAQSFYWLPIVLRYLKDFFERFRKHHGFRRYFSNTSWMLAEQILRLIAGLLVGVWVARYLGPEQYGLFSYALAFVAIFGSIAKLGLNGIIVRNLVHEPNKRDVYLGTAFWLKFFGSVITIGIVAFATLFTSNDRTTNLYIFIIASGIVFQSFEVIDFYFQSKVLSKFVSLCNMLQLLVSSLLKICFVLMGAGLFWFVVVSLVDQVLLSVSLFFAYRYQKLGNFYRHFDFMTAKTILKDSWPLIISSFVVMVYMRIDQIMIKEMLGDREVGFYSAAVRLSEVWYFIPMVITTSFFPAIVSAKKVSKELYQTRLQRLYSAMVWLAIGIAFLMTFLSDRVVVFLYGEFFQEAAGVLMIHIWAGVFVSLGVVSGKWFLSENLQKISTINTVTGALANVLLNLILIPKYGISGAAISTLLSYSIAACFMNLAFKKSRDNFFRMLKSIIIYS